MVRTFLSQSYIEPCIESEPEYDMGMHGDDPFDSDNEPAYYTPSLNEVTCSCCSSSGNEINMWARVVISKTPTRILTSFHRYPLCIVFYRPNEIYFRHVCNECARDMVTFFERGPIAPSVLSLLDSKLPADLVNVVHEFVTDFVPSFPHRELHK